MAQLPFEIHRLLSAPGIRQQIMEAVETLATTGMSPPEQALGWAYKICETWQRRFELAVRGEVPDWVGLAAFRCSLDFSLPPGNVAQLKPDSGSALESCSLKTLEEVGQAYTLYLEQRQNLYAGKFLVQDKVIQDWFLEQVDKQPGMPGGQAGNIAWLWHCIGTVPRVYMPYLSQQLTNLASQQPRLGAIQVLVMENGQGDFVRLADAQPLAGVPMYPAGRCPAPARASITVSKNDRRMNYMLSGSRILDPQASDPPIWKQVQFFFQGQPLLEQPLQREKDDVSWPAIPLFSECRINAEAVLEITLADEAQVTRATQGKVDFAVLGGMDAIYYDDWLQRAPKLQARLLNILEKQLKALAAAGVRVGVELSGIPRREYALRIQRLCRQGVIVALGINGVEELPSVVGEESLEKELHEFWFDPQTLDAELRAEAGRTDNDSPHFEYLTYRRAKHLAETTGVRTLYVHTLTLDFILRRDADPGALLRAQLGDMMGKGLVIVALLQRAYGDQWHTQLREMPPAVNPKAMARLGQFALDFELYERANSARERLLTSGYWLAPSPEAYSVAVVPVVWPAVSEKQSEKQLGPDLPPDLNPTGAGDMTFGAFFFLGGV